MAFVLPIPRREAIEQMHNPPQSPEINSSKEDGSGTGLGILLITVAR